MLFHKPLLHPLFFALSLLSLLSLSRSTDTISTNFSLSGTQQKLISSQNQFALGFFQPPNSSNWYIGIWYNTISLLTSVWVANRNTPIKDPTLSKLSLSSSGNLVLLDDSKTEVWSTNITNILSTNTTEAVLLDTGNLVLRYLSNTSDVLWQSWDYPTNTWLPGAKLGLNKMTEVSRRLSSWKNRADPADSVYSFELDPNGTSQYFIQWNKTRDYWKTGSWNPQQQIFTLVPEMTENYIYNFSYVSNAEENYFTYSVKPGANVTSRFIMDYTGQIKQLTWMNSAQEWILFFSQPTTQCDVYAICGPYGSCNENSLPYCNCIKGFSQKSEVDWNLGDYSSGCVRNTPLQCKITGFYTMDNMRFPDNPQSFQIDSLQDCESACLNDCSCTAYSYQNGCYLWYGELYNLQEQYTRSAPGGTLYLRLATTELPNNNKSHKGLIIGLIIGGIGFASICIIVGLVVIRKRRRRRERLITMPKSVAMKSELSLLWDVEEEGKNFELLLFTFECMAAATNNFDGSNKLGQGGFGLVYKGRLPGGDEIAVKRLSATSGQGFEEFKNEVILIAKLQHRNLVRLLGCCIQGEEKILVYEYLPNKSLDAFLFDPTKRELLDWELRFNIIEGIARGLLYLHRDSRLRVVHRDLKASNILLDKDMDPKISDFGMARIFGGDQNQENTKRVVGTLGYMSPEYAMQGLFSVKSDVYSFGVLILEIITGERNSSLHLKGHSLNIVGYAWNLWNEDKAIELIDPMIRSSCTTNEVLRCIHVALLCVQDLANDRPEMPLIIKMLTNENSHRPSPKRPPFTLQSNLYETHGMGSLLESFSTYDVTITTAEGR